jgi:hypothetical protein
MLGLVCWSNFLLGRYDDAMPACEKTAARDNTWGNQVWLVAGYAQQGDIAKAGIAKTEVLGQQTRFTVEKFKARGRYRPAPSPSAPTALSS